MKFTSTFFVSFLFFSTSFSQVISEINAFNRKDSAEVLSTYYTDLTDKVLVKFSSNIKYTGLQITNRNTSKTLKMAPASSLDLGLAFNYKWLGLGFSLGLPSGKESDSTKGKTQKFDIQLNVYSKRFVVDALYQRYKGFHIANPGDFYNWDTTSVFPQLPSMQISSLGVSAYYIFNYKKFSYKAAYVRNEVQNKSAGSLLVGPFFNRDGGNTVNGFVPSSLPSDVQDSFDVDYFSSISYGLAVGYTYSVVLKNKFFMNFSLVPGLGVKNIKTNLNGKERASTNGLAGRVSYRFALGYEHQWFLLGLTAYGTQGNIVINNFEFKPGGGMFRLFVARRLDIVRKKKNPLNKLSNTIKANI